MKSNVIKYKPCSLEKSFPILFPSLLKDWDYDLNDDADPYKISCGSHYQAYWKCSTCNHSWQANLNNRTTGHGCPVCGRQQAAHNHKAANAGINDLMTIHPDIAAQWDYSKNDKSPSKVKPGSRSKYYWLCDVCRHSWKASINNRTCGNGCPSCGIIKRAHTQSLATTGVDDLATLYPKIAAQWDHDKNGDRLPSTVRPGSDLVYQWLCSICSHSWSATAISRRNGSDCPKCHRWGTSKCQLATEFYLDKFFPNCRVFTGKQHDRNIDIIIETNENKTFHVEYDGSYFHGGNKRINTEDSPQFKLNKDKDRDAHIIKLDPNIHIIRLREKDCPLYHSINFVSIVNIRGDSSPYGKHLHHGIKEVVHIICKQMNWEVPTMIFNEELDNQALSGIFSTVRR